MRPYSPLNHHRYPLLAMEETIEVVSEVLGMWTVGKTPEMGACCRRKGEDFVHARPQADGSILR